MTRSTRLRGDDHSQFSMDEQVDILCDEFEKQWQSGTRPDLEAFLNHAGEIDPQRLLHELIALDVEHRRKRGETPSPDEYAARFPQLFDPKRQSDQPVDTPGLSATVAFGPRDHRTLVVGQRFEQFELVEHIGNGAFGSVWKARDTTLKRTVALKLPRAGQLSDDELRRFIREGQAAAQLGHRNVVSVHEVGRHDDSAFIVSDYIHGTGLRQWRALGQSLRDVVEMCAKIADGVEHAHQRGVIHRDLKPANILVDFDNEPHVTDFGLAKWTGDASGLTQQGAMLGTPVYMSPEQARGDSANVDCRSDVYALGVLLYELTTGERPFSGDYAQVFQATIHDQPRSPRSVSRNIPRDVETICLKAIAKDPADRYPTAAEMAVDLRRHLRGETILARPAGALSRSWRWMKRRPASATAILTGLAAGCSLAVSAMFYSMYDDALGLQTAEITTKPPGAKIAFVPLSKQTEEPQRDDVHFARGVSPVRERLKPGKYLVVAVLENGRFHEVFRTIPEISEAPRSHDHIFFERAPDGSVEIPEITIPREDEIQEIETALIEGTDRFLMGVSESDGLQQIELSVSSFHAATTEFTVADYRRLYRNSSVGKIPRNLPPDGFAMPANFNDAVAYAENSGMRLPTEVEYEYMATNRGRNRYPWGDEMPDDEAGEKFGPIGVPIFDQLATEPPVLGLASHVAEWTSSPMVPYLPNSRQPLLKDHRVVRGGDRVTVNGDPAVNHQARDPRRRHSFIEHETAPGLGFRCVRSAEPMFDFHEIP